MTSINRPGTPQRFIRTLFSGTIYFVFFGTGAVLLTLCAYYIDGTPPLRVWFAVIALAFLVAAYWAWRDERSYANTLESSLGGIQAKNQELVAELDRTKEHLAKEKRALDPSILFEIEDCTPRPVADIAGSIELYLQVSIRNSGQETVLHNWKLRRTGKPRDIFYLNPSRILKGKTSLR